MRRKVLARRPSPAMVVALVALVSSLTGGAVAATLITGADIKNASITNKDIKKGAVRGKQVKNGSLLSSDFKAGQLPAGLQGPKGDKGDACLPTNPACVGPQGPAGADGTDGTDGADGTDGEPGPFPATLPTGKTVKGAFYIRDVNPSGGGTTTASDSISFVYRPASTPAVHYLGAGTHVNCPGSVGDPRADPGHLCIYTDIPNRVNIGSAGATSAHSTGVGVFATSTTTAGTFEELGTWAVTGP